MMQKKIRPFLYQLFVLTISSVFFTNFVFAQSGTKAQVEDINTEAFPQTEVYVSVTNPQGYPVENLTADNFSLKEDGNSVDNFNASLELNMQQALSFILAIDTSGSMNYDGPQTRLENAVNAATSFVESLPPQDEVGLITFGKEVKTVQSITTDHTSVKNALQNLEADENTYLYDGVIAAIEELTNTQNRRVIILITDGMDSGEGNHSYESVIEQSIENAIPIYTLGFGDVDVDELTKMATITGGIAQINPNSDDLISGFNQIMDILRKQYALRFQSTLQASNQEHTISISVNYLDETYTSEKSFFIDTAPRISIGFETPNAGEELSSSQEILVSVDSKYDIEKVVISANDEELATLTSPPYLFKWQLYDVHNGEYIIKAEVFDEKGLSSFEEITVAVNQVGGGGSSGVDNSQGEWAYLILALFAFLLIILVAFGIRKRHQKSTIQQTETKLFEASLVEVAGRNPNNVWKLNSPEKRLGRKADINDIPLKGSKASREMAIIQSRENQHIIYSVKSNNPILVNDIPIQRETILRTGDIISMGESVFKYEIQS